jgi:hypothetical protein
MVSPQGVMDLAAMSGGGTTGGTAPGAMSDEEYCKALEAQQANKPSVADVIPGGRLLGRLGRKKGPEPPPPSDPRCPPKK